MWRLCQFRPVCPFSFFGPLGATKVRYCRLCQDWAGSKAQSQGTRESTWSHQADIVRRITPLSGLKEDSKSVLGDGRKGIVRHTPAHDARGVLIQARRGDSARDTAKPGLRVDVRSPGSSAIESAEGLTSTTGAPISAEALLQCRLRGSHRWPQERRRLRNRVPRAQERDRC